MTGSSSSSSSSEPSIGVPDLQLMLQGRLGSGTRVAGVSVSSLLPPGENFACSLVKLEVRLAKGDNEEEPLELVAKLFPSADYVRGVFDFIKLFEKELFFYDRLMPSLRQIDAEFGSGAEQGLFEIAPELYGLRYSRDPSSKVIDDGVVLLLDNLKSKGYYTGHKTEGLDLAHSRATIKALARFHALSIACKQHRPDFLKNDVLRHARPVPFKEDKSFDLFQLILDMMLADSRFAEHRDKLRAALCDGERKQLYFQFMAEEPWLGIAHSDFWTNNILFKRDPISNDIADVKFIDFQAYQYNSPLRDLPYFLCSSTSAEVMSNHLDELLELYHESFVASLRRTQVDQGPFNRESFDRQLNIDAGLEFFHNILAIKFFFAEIDANTYDPQQLDKIVLCSQINKGGLDRWYQIVQTYVERGWL